MSTLERKRPRGAGERARPDTNGTAGSDALADPTSTARLRNIEAEDRLNGSLLQDREAFAEIRGTVAAGDFFIATNRIIFQAIAELYESGSGVDVVIVGDLLQKKGDFERVGGALELTRLLECVPSAANVVYYARIVRQLADRRRFIEKARRLSEQVASLAVEPEQAELDLLAALASSASSSLSNGFEYLNLDEIAANGIPPLDWLLPGWLVRGDVAIVAGPAYSGKSTTIGALLIALASGRPWCGITPSTTGDVLAFDEEQGEALTARLFLRLGARGMSRLRVASGQGVNVASAAGFTRLEREIEKTRPLVVALDSATQVFGGIDENSAEQVGPVFARLFRLRDKYGVTLLILRHLRKPSAEGKVDLLTSVRGSTTWGTQASTVWVAQRIDDASIDLIQVKRRGASPTSLRINYAEECSGGAIALTGGPRLDAEETKSAELRQSVLDALEAAAPELLTREEVRERVGGRAEAIVKALAEMAKAGEIEREGTGRSRNPYRFGSRLREPSSHSHFPSIGEGTAERTGDGASIPGSRNSSESRNGPKTERGVEANSSAVSQVVADIGGTDLEAAKVDVGADELEEVSFKLPWDSENLENA